MYISCTPTEYGPANKKHLIWASPRFLLGRHRQTTLSIDYFIPGTRVLLSVEFTTEESFFLPLFSERSPKK